MIRISIARTYSTEKSIDNSAGVLERKYELCTNDEEDLPAAFLWEALGATHIGPGGWGFLAEMVTYCWEDQKHFYDEGSKRKDAAIVKRFADAAFAVVNSMVGEE